MEAMLGEDLDEWLWPASCPELRHMENALRCQICGDFFHGPVLLPCTHTFCSECVRRFLQMRGNNGCCPECKQPCAPGELVPNRTLEKIGVLFQQMKPKVLPVLEKAKVPDKISTPIKANGDGKPPERMTLLSYNVMKEKDIKKLLEAIGIRLQVKNREDIIQIHKEYVLLANAQADSSHPKSAKQVREEVLRNYRARQAEKQSSGSARKSLDAGQTPVVTAEMQAGFERLRQQVKARNGQQKAAKKEEDGDEEKRSLNGTGRKDEDDDKDDDDDNLGVWRHVHVVKSDLDFYIHSTTQEIRTEPPRAFLEHQQRLKERLEQAAAVAPADECEDDDEPVVLGTRNGPTSQTEVTEIASADDDDDFEIMITSPPSKPPLGSRNSTPQSQSLSTSARKTTERRRSSIGSNSSSTSAAAASAFVSQETSCSIQETSTQFAQSASLSLPSQLSSRTGDNLSGSPDDNSAGGSQAAPLTDTKWECPRCTLVNESVGSALAECEACGYRHQLRSARKKQKLQFQSKIFQP